MKSKTSKKIKTHVSDEKKKIVKELEELVKSKKTIVLASIKNIPASQFQEIGKKLRGKAIVKVPRKNLISRAIDELGNENLNVLKNYIKDSSAILFSDLDPFELAAELVRNKTPAKAKPGQEAPEDIEIPAGPTDLVPGPAISELGALGIQIQIEKGKIHIKNPKIIAKKGEKISDKAAELMSKLDIKPFSIGFIPVAAYDTKDNKLYLEISIDTEKAITDLKEAFSKSLAFAVEIGYVSNDTIKLLIQKAARHEMVLLNLVGKNAADADINKSDNKGYVVKSNEHNDKIQKDIGNNNSNQSSELASEQNTQSDKTEDSDSGGN